MSENKTEKKIKFTVIDFIIILVLLAAVVFGATKLLPSLGKSEKETTEFTVMVQKADNDFAEAINAGDNITISLTEKDGGVVKDVRSEPAMTMAYNSIDGTYAKQEIPGKRDVYITIEAQTDVSDLAIKTGGTAVKVGSEIPVRGKGYASMGYIIEIND